MTLYTLYKLVAFTFCFVVINNKIVAQNLVLNPSFEDTLVCPQSNPLISFLRPVYWFRPTGGSSDFFNTDTNCAWGGGVPQNVFGFQGPKTGNAYCGFSIYNAPPLQNVREYITGTLSDSLKVGNKYCVSFWISAANNCIYQTDDISTYFSDDTSSFTNYSMNNVLNLIPQFENTQGTMLLDTLNWIQISGDFIAQGGEKYVTFGNFKNDANTTLTLLPGGIYNFGYYYIDDVSVIDCTVGLEENEIKSSEFTIYPNPAIETLTITINLLKTINISYRIDNILGEFLREGNIFQNKTIINISDLCSGVYSIRFSNQNGTISKKFIKM